MKERIKQVILNYLEKKELNKIKKEIKNMTIEEKEKLAIHGTKKQKEILLNEPYVVVRLTALFSLTANSITEQIEKNMRGEKN